MSDKELLQELMDATGWSQQELAQEIGFGKANVTRILQEKQKLSRTSRKVVEMLLEQSKE